MRRLRWFAGLVLIVIILVIIFFYVVMGGDINAFDNMAESSIDTIGYVTLLVYYLVMFFITNYFIAGVYIIVHGRFNGQNLSLRDGISGANLNLGKIFVWSLISATVGVVLQIIADRSKWIGKLVVFFLGSAWAILTYFSLPSLIVGQRTVKDSFKESATLIRKTWGETIIINFGVGLFFVGIIFFALALTIGILILAPIFEIFILMSILFIIFFVAVSIISSTLSFIFKLALYEFALTGNVPLGFTSDLVRGAIKKGK